MVKRILWAILLLAGLWSGVILFGAEEPKKDKPQSDEEKAKTAVVDAYKKTTESKGYHVEWKMSLKPKQEEAMNVEITFDLQGVMKNPDFCHLKGKTTQKGMGKEAEKEAEGEVYIQGKQTVSKESTSDDKGKWRKEPTTINLPDAISIPKDVAEKHKFGKEEKVKDKECTVVEAILTNAVLKEFSKKMAMPLLEGKATLEQSNCKFWIDKKDGALMRVMYNLNVSYELPQPPEPPGNEGDDKEEPAPPQSKKAITKVAMDFTLFDYNKDIDIKIPDEVQKLLKGDEEKEE